MNRESGSKERMRQRRLLFRGILSLVGPTPNVRKDFSSSPDDSYVVQAGRARRQRALLRDRPSMLA